jgi:tripartite-type tricarboxylate transporter receptor subunit TctC
MGRLTNEYASAADGTVAGRIGAWRAWFLAALLLASAAPRPAGAQNAVPAEDWPGKQTIRIIVPFSAGSNADLMGRAIASYLGEGLKATMVVENRVGTGGILGTRAFSKSPPDGYTLCVCSGGAITVPSTVEKQYDPQADLVPVSRINSQPLVLVVKADAPIKSIADVIAAGKSKAGGLNYGSSGVGGLMYNSAEVFRSKSGAQLTHVPFRGGPEAMAALVAGEVELVFAIMSDVVSYIAAGTLRPIAVTTATRNPALPDVPTMIEQGIQGYDIALWNGLFVPRGTPSAIVDKLSALMLKMPSDPAAVRAVAGAGAVLSVSTPEELRESIRKEAALWETGLKDVVRN